MGSMARGVGRSVAVSTEVTVILSPAIVTVQWAGRAFVATRSALLASTGPTAPWTVSATIRPPAIELRDAASAPWATMVLLANTVSSFCDH